MKPSIYLSIYRCRATGWRCGASCRRSWNRNFVVCCGVTRRVGSAWKRESFGLAGEQHETLVPESRVTLQALRVTPLNAALEVQRLLAND